MNRIVLMIDFKDTKLDMCTLYKTYPLQSFIIWEIRIWKDKTKTEKQN